MQVLHRRITRQPLVDKLPCHCGGLVISYRKLRATWWNNKKQLGCIGCPCPLLEVDQVRPELPSLCGTLRDLFAVLPGFPHMWFLLSILFAVFAVVLEILERAHQVVSRLNLPAPLFTHKSVFRRRLAGRVGASAPVTRFRGQHSRYHTGGRGTVLEKDSVYRRSITIEPVDCHSYKILQSRVHSFALFGAGKAEGFF